MGLPYAVELRPLSAEEGGGYVATIPQLGRKTFVAVADTPQEALEALEELKGILVPSLLAKGVNLPEPSYEGVSDTDCSGSLMLRVPPLLHASLVNEAQKQRISLNKMATYLLTRGLISGQSTNELRDAIRDIVSEEIHEILVRPHSNSHMKASFKGLSLQEVNPSNSDDNYTNKAA